MNETKKRRRKPPKASARNAAKAGRPAGAITENVGTAAAVKPLCRKCRSSDLRRERIIRELPFPAVHPDGAETTLRRWTRAQCRKCGAWQVIREDFNP